MKTRLAALLLSTAGLALAGTAAQAASWEQLVQAGGQGENWLVYGGDLANTRFAPSDQINTGNVARLRPKWIFQTGVIGSFQTTPIVEDGVMYVTAPYNHAYAVDARTGKQLWHYEHKLDRSYYCCGPNNRGVALAGDKVYMA